MGLCSGSLVINEMIKLFIPGKTTLILIAGLAVLIIILTITTLLTSPQNPLPQPSPISTSRPSENFLNNFPDASIEPDSSPNLVYNPTQLQKDYERLNADIPLVPSDSQIRNRLVTSLNNQSGVLQKTPEYNIKYVKSRDIFMIEIISENTSGAKSEAINWFKTEGLSTEGICNLPVSIYLNADTRDALANQNQTFNPIPEGCE